MTTDYLDFDLLLEPLSPSENRYRSCVFNSPVGRMTTEFEWPHLLVQSDDDRTNIVYAHRNLPSPKPTPSVDATEFGTQLYKAVFNGPIQACLWRSQEIAQHQGKELRLRLRLVNVPHLVDLPWESLYDPSRNCFLALHDNITLIRYLEMARQVQPLTISLPLHVLLLIASPTNDESHRLFKWDRIKAALAHLEEDGIVRVTPHPVTNIDALQDTLQEGEYHVAQWIGAGDLDRWTSDDSSSTDPASSLSLNGLLSHHPSLRLCMFTSSLQVNPSEGRYLGRVSRELVRGGIPAVIAVQQEITDASAAILTQELYHGLASGFPVDSTLTEARKAIFAQHSTPQEEDAHSWGMPILHMRSSNGYLFEIEQKAMSRPRRRPNLKEMLQDGAVGQEPLQSTVETIVHQGDSTTRISESRGGDVSTVPPARNIPATSSTVLDETETMEKIDSVHLTGEQESPRSSHPVTTDSLQDAKPQHRAFPENKQRVPFPRLHSNRSTPLTATASTSAAQSIPPLSQEPQPVNPQIKTNRKRWWVISAAIGILLILLVLAGFYFQADIEGALTARLGGSASNEQTASVVVEPSSGLTENSVLGNALSNNAVSSDAASDREPDNGEPEPTPTIIIEESIEANSAGARVDSDDTLDTALTDVVVEPTITPTPEPQNFAEVDTLQLNLRSGPGAYYFLLDTYLTGEKVEVIGKNREGTWVKVLMDDGQEGWMDASWLRIEDDVLSNAPLAEIPPTPSSWTNSFSVTLVEPKEEQLYGVRTFRWDPNFNLPPYYAYELVFWEVGTNRDVDSRSPAPATRQNFLTINLDLTAESPDVPLRKGREFYWGVFLVETNTFTRIRFLGEPHRFRFE